MEAPATQDKILYHRLNNSINNGFIAFMFDSNIAASGAEFGRTQTSLLRVNHLWSVIRVH